MSQAICNGRTIKALALAERGKPNGASAKWRQDLSQLLEK